MRSKKTDFVIKQLEVIERIKYHYGNKLKRNVSEEEAREIAQNLLQFIKAIYGFRS